MTASVFSDPSSRNREQTSLFYFLSLPFFLELFFIFYYSRVCGGEIESVEPEDGGKSRKIRKHRDKVRNKEKRVEKEQTNRQENERERWLSARLASDQRTSTIRVDRRECTRASRPGPAF